MPRKQLYQELYIYMNGIQVGTLIRESTGYQVFSYDQNWLQDENRRPISLSMPLTEIPFKGPVVDNYFDNLLPDSELIRERIQARFNTPSKKSFDLLSQIGGDCVGALQILAKPTKKNIKKIETKLLTAHDIAKLLKNYQTAPLGMARDTDFRISIAGAQEKTALLWHENKWHLPHGATPTSHIMKLPIGKLHHSGIDLSESVENEWLCLKLLSAYGLSVNEARIEKFDDQKVLIVERFDRRWSTNGSWLMRLPQEDFCQALGKPSALKYESDGSPGIQDILKVLQGANDAVQDRKNFMKTVFLFWVLGAIDGHAKNFSISIEAGGHYKLTPIYDVISAYPLVKNQEIPVRKLKMAMSLKSKNRHYVWNDIQPRHWLAMANFSQFSEIDMRQIMDEVLERMDGVIDEVSNQLPKNYPIKMAEAVFSMMKMVKKRFGVRY